MKPLLCLFGIAGAVLFGPVSASAAPANDSFANPIELRGPIVTATGSNVGATKQFPGEPFIAGNFGGASVWWTWTATASGQTTIDTSGSDFNTLLGVYTGNAVNQLTTIADNIDYNGNTWSRVQFNAVAGTVYHISVDGIRTGGGFGTVATGNITLHVQGVGGLTITTPTNGMVVTLGDPIPVAVTIDGDFPNPPATHVDFYLGGPLFASSAPPPFSAVASNAPAGSNNFYVVAFDSTGMPIQSSVVTMFVQSIGVTLLTPFQDALFFNTNPITVTAHGFLPSGSITNIEFFVDGVKFGEDAAAPFSAVWSNVVSGSHRLTAIGRSDAGLPYNSQPVNIRVAQIIVPTKAVWEDMDNGSDQGTAWIAPAFDDSGWASGPAQLGYGDGDEATIVNSGPTNNYYITTYFRRAFTASNVSSLNNLFFSLGYDDAGVDYLNGQEIYRTANLPPAPNVITYTNFATGQAIEETVDVFIRGTTNLLEGTNVLAVEIHQQALSRSDISLYLQLIGAPVIIHNLSPDVALNSPTNGAYFLAPASLTLEATAADADGSVAKVEFFSDGVKVGETNSADNGTYRVVWTAPPIGAHVLTAVATDDQGATTTSAEIPIVAYDAVGTPVAQITSPLDGAVMEGPTNLLFTATAHGTNGVASVEFRANGVPFGTDAIAPYTALWPSIFLSNSFVAIVTDLNGARGTSAVVNLFITIPPTNVIAPTIATQNPLAGSNLTNTFTSLTVTFSEFVQNVDAGDLLVNGVPATGVSGTTSNYVFSFAQPPRRIRWPDRPSRTLSPACP